jgi:uncharacterized protein
MKTPLRLLLPAALAAATALAADTLAPLTVRDVKLRGEIGRRIDATIRNNLLVLDADKDFLRPFQERTGKESYIGLGKLILSAARLAAYSNDARAIELERRVVERLLATQDPDGYLGVFPVAKRTRALWDIHESGYLVAGLVADYRYFGRRESLAGARKLADYVMAHWGELPEDWGRQTGVATHVAVTGVERTWLDLYDATRDRRYLDFVTVRRALGTWDLPIVVGRRPLIEGHIYAYTARALAQLELNRIAPSPALLVNARREIDFLTRSDGMLITGGAGQFEIYTDDQDGRGEPGETCATAYQIRLYDAMLRLTGDARYGDLIERTVFNALLAAQSPDGRRLRYYSPLEGQRKYHPTDTYCCPCNYRRIVAELPELVYYRSGAGVTVSQYAASETAADIGGVKTAIAQETAFPSSGTVTIRVSPARPASFAVRLRIPSWAAGATVRVNGEPPSPARPGAFFAVSREWRTGDAVRLEMPMTPRLTKGRQRQAGRAAVMRGPLVYCLNPGAEKALAGLDGADLGRFTLDPASLEVVADESVRPGGTAIRVGAWKPGHSIATKTELTLRLTEFPDPGGMATYFRLRDGSAAQDDPILKPR